MPIDWITILSLIVFGLLLIVVELIFIPGTTIIGVFGFLLAVAGIWVSYATVGTPEAHFILGATVAVGVAAVFISFKSNVWARFSLKEVNKGRVNEDVDHDLRPGDTGDAVSALRPSGTARFDERYYEVRTAGEFIEAGTPVRITKIKSKKITVEPIT